MSDNREHCHFCNRLFPVDELKQVDILTCRQTYSSPAEYDEVWLCAGCEEPRDEDYERANIKWRETHGGEL